jgi:DNA invertase Pin-like site-specific DNA recombinase
MKVYGYARVSTRGQDYETQEDKIKTYCRLKDFELVDIFADKRSGKDMDRPALQEMLTRLETNPLEIKAIVVTKLDRIGRSIRDLIKFVDWCKSKNLDFVSIGDSIDTTTKEGRLIFYIMSALAEFERELIMERTETGKKRFLEKGGKFGPKEKFIDVEKVKRLIADGVPMTRVAKDMKVSRATIYSRLREAQA